MASLVRTLWVGASMVFLGLGVAGGRADAQTPPPAALPTLVPHRAPPTPRKRERLDHAQQTGLSLMPGTGYEIRVPYQENKTCGDATKIDSKRVCTTGTPFFLDLQLSYSVTSVIDVLADVRFGIGKEDLQGVGRQFALAPGIRVWLDHDTRLKFFTTVQFLYDYTKWNQVDVSAEDFGIRNANGVMYDVIRNVGFYLQFGESIGFKRWFRISLDVGTGVQVRFP